MNIINIHVIPKASKNEIIGWVGGADGRPVLKVKIKAPPEDGKANAELLRFLAKEWGVAKSAIEITGGETSRHKRLEINGNISLFPTSHNPS